MIVASSQLIKVVPGLMIWTLVAFGLTFFVLKRFAFKPIQKAIDDRRERIMQTLEEADEARDEARRLLEEHKQLMAQARTDAEAILAEAPKAAGRTAARVDERNRKVIENTWTGIDALTNPDQRDRLKLGKFLSLSPPLRARSLGSNAWIVFPFESCSRWLLWKCIGQRERRLPTFVRSALGPVGGLSSISGGCVQSDVSSLEGRGYWVLGSARQFN